ncbi:hypothetical protein ACQKD8_21500, partial [Pseudomonas sp. NPDC077405]
RKWLEMVSTKNRCTPCRYLEEAGRWVRRTVTILFLSDVVEELDAAQLAGMRTCGLVREGGELTGHPAVASFDAIDPRRYRADRILNPQTS